MGVTTTPHNKGCKQDLFCFSFEAETFEILFETKPSETKCSRDGDILSQVSRPKRRRFIAADNSNTDIHVQVSRINLIYEKK